MSSIRYQSFIIDVLWPVCNVKVDLSLAVKISSFKKVVAAHDLRSLISVVEVSLLDESSSSHGRHLTEIASHKASYAPLSPVPSPFSLTSNLSRPAALVSNFHLEDHCIRYVSLL